MHKLLTKLLQKRNIETIEQLDPEEKQTYESWQGILSKETLTLEDLQIFCRSQIGVIESKWSDLKVEQTRKAELIPYHTVYKLILAAIDSPQAARKALEDQLNQLINQ